MREKIEKMQLAFPKAQGMDGCLYNMEGISSKTPIELPLKFKVSNVEKFDGIGDPKQHVRRYLSIVEMKELDENQTLHAFPLSLTRGASRWYYSLDPSMTKVWNELMELFMDQFILNTMNDVTLREATRMVNRPNENDQINMIIKNLLPAYNSKVLSSLISYFGELCDCRTRIEDAINNGLLEKVRANL